MSEDTKECPFCAETIKAKAVVCRYCGRDQPPLVPKPQKKRRSGCCVVTAGAGVALVLIVICLIANLCGSPFDESATGTATLVPTDAPREEDAAESTDVPIPTDAPEPTEEAVRTITTVRGDMTVPGIGYLDGRDTEADPPLTVMNINIWDSAQRTRAVCQLDHGTQVDVLDAEWVEDEDRHYFQITGDGCEGWIQAPFISPEYHEPIGDEM